MLTINGVKGHLTLGDARLLLNAAARVQPGGTIIEIGSYLGLSATLLAQASHPTVTVHCIDPWLSEPGAEYDGQDSEIGDAIYESFLEAIDPWAHRIAVHRGKSQEIAGRFEGQVADLVWIDGSHTYDDTRTDIKTWWTRVKTHGTMLVHDCEPGSEAGKAAKKFSSDVPCIAGYMAPPNANFIFEVTKLAVPVPTLDFVIEGEGEAQ